MEKLLDKNHPDTRYLVLVRAVPALPLGRVQSINEILQQMSGDRSKLLFSTPDGTSIGMIITASKAPAQIRAALQVHMPLKGEDFLLILELGDSIDGIGNSAGWRHLRRKV